MAKWNKSNGTCNVLICVPLKSVYTCGTAFFIEICFSYIFHCSALIYNNGIWAYKKKWLEKEVVVKNWNANYVIQENISPALPCFRKSISSFYLEESFEWQKQSWVHGYFAGLFCVKIQIRSYQIFEVVSSIKSSYVSNCIMWSDFMTSFRI